MITRIPLCAALACAITATAVPAQAQVPLAPVAAAPAEPRDPPLPPARSQKWVGGVILCALGGAGASVASTMLIFDGMLGSVSDPDTNRGAKKRLPAEGIGLGVGLAAVGTGVALIVVGRRESMKARDAAPTVSVGPTSALLTWRF